MIELQIVNPQLFNWQTGFRAGLFITLTTLTIHPCPADGRSELVAELTAKDGQFTGRVYIIGIDSQEIELAQLAEPCDLIAAQMWAMNALLAARLGRTNAAPASGTASSRIRY